MIIDNFGQAVDPTEITDHSYNSYDFEGSRTWITEDAIDEMDYIRLVRDAHLAISPDLNL